MGYRMGPAADATTAAMRRSLNLLERVDYRLAQTAAEKDDIYHLRYRAYSREGMVRECAERRVTDHFDDLPNAWTFGVHLFGELFSSIRISLLNAEWRQSTSAHVFGEIRLPSTISTLEEPNSVRMLSNFPVPVVARVRHRIFLKPLAKRVRTTHEPMNPFAPVTRIWFSAPAIIESSFT